LGIDMDEVYSEISEISDEDGRCFEAWNTHIEVLPPRATSPLASLTKPTLENRLSTKPTNPSNATSNASTPNPKTPNPSSTRASSP
jgi:hypothetical protein